MTVRSKDQAVVVMEPGGVRLRVEEGTGLLQVLRQAGFDLESGCNGTRSCGKCRVEVRSGVGAGEDDGDPPCPLSPVSAEETELLSPAELAVGMRLACAVEVRGDLLVRIPVRTRLAGQKVVKAAAGIEVALDPLVKPRRVEVPEPTMAGNEADFERLTRALYPDLEAAHSTIAPPALTRLAATLRPRGHEGPVEVDVWLRDGSEIIDVRPVSATRPLGLAVDIGTTTLAAHLADLTDGHLIATATMMNPQVRFGEDVLSRISHHQMSDTGLADMTDAIRSALNRLVDQALDAAADEPDGRSPSRSDIVDAAICCNTVMHHLLLGLDPTPLGELPFTPSVNRGLNVRATDIGLEINPAAKVYLFPNIAGFVGGDIVAATVRDRPRHTGDSSTLLLDIGTNGEMALVHRGGILCASCAIGPAFEGAQIKHGMRAAPGAIERVRIDPDSLEVDCRIIGCDAWLSDTEPGSMKIRGLCGSGALDALAGLVRAGLLTAKGTFSQRAKEDRRFRLDPDSGLPEFVLVRARDNAAGRDVVLSLADVRHLQLAKAAVRTGCDLLLRKAGLTRPDRVAIAGAFGNYIDKQAALTVGMFPDWPPEIISGIGNAAGDGCLAALLNNEARRQAEEILQLAQHVELSLEPDFQKVLLGNIGF